MISPMKHWILAAFLAFPGKNYVSPDKSFGFTIPPGLTLHQGPGKLEQTSYIPVCDEDAAACVLYPSDRYKGTTFGAAAFTVKLTDANTAGACETAPDIGDEKKAPNRTIAGVRFVHWVGEGAAMSHVLETHLYRGFTHRKCYELAINVTYTNYGVYDPGTIKEFTKQDEAKVVHDLEQVLDSFKILR